MRDRWVWFDFENTPHVLFLEPFIRRLQEDGCEVRITAKSQAQTLELAASRGLEVEAVGAGDLSGTGEKILGGLSRATALAYWAWRRGRPALLVSSSRTASLAAWMLRIRGVGLLDYEHAEHKTLALGSRSLWFPDVLRDVHLPRTTRRVARFYAGLKENLYLDSWALDRAAERRALGVTDADYLVVARPPAATAHYAAQASGRLWMAAVEGLAQRSGARVLVAPRNAAQRRRLTNALAGHPGVHVLSGTVTGPAVVTAADLVVGGGGTMNREAAVLGVPVWSVFNGPTPHVDLRLESEGRLRWIRSEDELAAALRAPRPSRQSGRGPFPEGLAAILRDICSALGANHGAAA